MSEDITEQLFFSTMTSDNAPFFQQYASVEPDDNGLPAIHWFDYDQFYSDHCYSRHEHSFNKEKSYTYYYESFQLPLKRICRIIGQDNVLYLATDAVRTQHHLIFPTGGLPTTPNSIQQAYTPRVEKAQMPFSQVISFSIEEPYSFYTGNKTNGNPYAYIIVAHATGGKFMEISSTMGFKSDVIDLFQLLTETFILKRREIERWRPTATGVRRAARWDDDDVI